MPGRDWLETRGTRSQKMAAAKKLQPPLKAILFQGMNGSCRGPMLSVCVKGIFPCFTAIFGRIRAEADVRPTGSAPHCRSQRVGTIPRILPDFFLLGKFSLRPFVRAFSGKIPRTRKIRNQVSGTRHRASQCLSRLRRVAFGFRQGEFFNSR